MRTINIDFTLNMYYLIFIIAFFVLTYNCST